MKRLDGRTNLAKQDWLCVDTSIFIKREWGHTFATGFIIFGHEYLAWWYDVLYDDPVNINLGNNRLSDFRIKHVTTQRCQ